MNFRATRILAAALLASSCGLAIGATKQTTFAVTSTVVNEENQKLYDRIINTMLNKLGYCRTCAQETIEYFCTQEDEK